MEVVQPIIASKHYCSMKEMKYPDPSSQSKGTLIIIMENLHRIKNVTACIAFLSKILIKYFATSYC